MIDLSNILPDGFKLVGRIAKPILKSPAELEGVCFHKPGEEYVRGETALERAPGLESKLGFADLKLCLENKELIPKELQDLYVIFPKAIALNPGRCRCVFYLYCNGSQSRVGYGWLDDDWFRDDVLGRRRKSLVLGNLGLDEKVKQLVHRVSRLEKLLKKNK